MDAGYPPEPWRLRGRMHLSVFAVPRAALPALPLPPVRLPGGRVPVGAAWVRYEPGGDLTYLELLAAVLVHDRGRPRVSIAHIWVDSVASRDGGRALWAIPKDLAELTIRPGADGGTVAAAHTGPGPGGTAAPIGAATFRAGRRLPGRFPVAMTVVQAGGGGLCRTPVRGSTTVRGGAGTWRLAARAPLGYLAGRRPIATLTLDDFRLRFGPARN